MISEDHIQSAIAAGILDEATANALKAHVMAASDVADEEHFRLISGFNDILSSSLACYCLPPLVG